MCMNVSPENVSAAVLGGGLSHRGPRLPHRWRCGRSGAFTLLELLAVISIILVLAALLFPAFGSFRARSLDVKCVNNLRQIGQLISVYASENDGWYPWGYDNLTTSPFWAGGALTILVDPNSKASGPPTRKNVIDLFRCPSCSFKGSAVDYGINVRVAGWSAGATPHHPRFKAVNVRRPQETVLVADNGNDSGSVPRNDRPYFDNMFWPYQENIGIRHGGKANILFCDQHIEKRAPSELTAANILP